MVVMRGIVIPMNEVIWLLEGKTYLLHRHRGPRSTTSTSSPSAMWNPVFSKSKVMIMKDAHELKILNYSSEPDER